MDPVVLPTLAALGGSIVGASASVMTSWLTQRGQYLAQQQISDRTRREALYSEFIIEASTRYVEAVQAEQPEIGQLVSLLALVGRIRLFADGDTVHAAEMVVTRLMATYFEAVVTSEDLRSFDFAIRADPLLEFSTQARSELLRLH